jgi:PAS domain-containing protein
MSASLMPLTLTGPAMLLAGLGIAALTFVAALHRRLNNQNQRLINAIDNMSQGLCMFDAQGRIVVVNRRYLEMYKLSADVVKPGCTLHELIQHRKDTPACSSATSTLIANVSSTACAKA